MPQDGHAHPQGDIVGAGASSGRIAYAAQPDLLSSPSALDVFTSAPDGSDRHNVTQHPASDRFPSWHPDGSRIVFQSNRDGGPDEIYVINTDGTNAVRFTSDAFLDRAPQWSPDGSKILWQSVRPGGSNIFVMNADGSSPTQLTFISNAASPRWSPDGLHILFDGSVQESDLAVHMMDANGSNLVQLTQGFMQAGNADWSPDGSRIVFSDNACLDCTRVSNVYVMRSDGTDLEQLTAGFGNNLQATWSPDGSRIIFSHSEAVPPVEEPLTTLPSDLYVMDPDGGAKVNVTITPLVYETGPDWGGD